MVPAFINNPVAIVAVVGLVLLLFGGSKVPEMMKGLGQGVKEFKKGMNTDEDDELQKEQEREKAIRGRVEAEMKAEEKAAEKTDTSQKSAL